MTTDQPIKPIIKPRVQRIRSMDMLFVMDALAALLLVWYLSPVAKQIGRSVFFAGAFGVWLVLSLCVDRRWLGSMTKSLPFLAAWFVVYIGNFLAGRSTMFFEYMFVMGVFFAPAFLYMFYERTGQTAKLKFFLGVILVMFTITGLTTLVGQIRYPNSARLISTGVVEYGAVKYASMNIANYGFAYGLMLLVIALAGYAKLCARGRVRVALIALIVFFLLTMYKMEFTTSLLLVAVGVVVSLWFNGWRAVLAGVIAAACVLLASLFVQFSGHIADVLAGSGLPVNIRDRLVQLVGLFSQGSAAGDLMYRSDLYSVSLKSFLDNPLFGVGGLYGYGIALHGVGGHSEIFDIMARYGIIGLIFMACFFVAWFAELNRSLRGSRLLGSVRVAQWAFLALAVINVIFVGPEIGVVLFFAVPAVARLSPAGPHRLPGAPCAISGGVEP